MKVKGHSLVSKNREVIKLVRDGKEIPITICPLPNGFMLKMRTIGLGVYPEPPLQPKALPSGRVVRGDDRKVEYEPNESDPTYIQQTALFARRITAVKLRELLRDEPSMEWDTPDPADDYAKSWTAYADSLASEVSNSGLTDSEIAHIVMKGTELANGFDIEAGVDRFLLDAPQAGK